MDGLSRNASANVHGSRPRLAIVEVMLNRKLFAIFAAAVYFTFAFPLVAQNTSRDDMDLSVKPGDDFYRYANGGWLAAAKAAGRKTYDNRTVLNERTTQRVRDLVHEAAGSHAAQGSIQQKVGDYYASFLDQESVEAKGFAPIAGDLAEIAGIADTRSLSAYLGSTLNTEIDGLINNSDHVLGLFVNQGFADSKRNYSHLLQGGLGLPDRESYLDPSANGTEARAHYQAQIAAVLKLAGVADPAAAARVLALEVELARLHAPDSDAADVFKQNNPWKRSDFDSKAPGMDWNAYFKAAGMSEQADFIVWQPTAVTGTSALVKARNSKHGRTTSASICSNIIRASYPKPLRLKKAPIERRPPSLRRAAR